MKYIYQKIVQYSLINSIYVSSIVYYESNIKNAVNLYKA